MHSRYALWVVGVLLLVRCANIRSPQGGPKDNTAPQVVEAIPPNASLHFAQKSFSLTFDEWVQLSSIRDELMVSPPLEKAPEVTLKKRTVTVSWDETLRENTTYAFYFGDGVRDFTEANPAEDLVYLFSTGDALDSLFIPGRVEDAFTGEPKSGFKVLAYRAATDSVGMLQRPDYFTRTDQEGNFRLANMAEGQYHIVAVEDVNADYMVTPLEATAFLDSVVDASADSSAARLAMRSFTQPADRQFISTYATDSTGRLQLVPSIRSAGIRFTDVELPERRIVTQWSQDGDTLSAWLTGAPTDSDVRVSVQDGGVVLDTVLVRFYTQDERGLGLTWQQKGSIDARAPIRLRSSVRIAEWDTTRMAWVKDSISTAPTVRMNPDDALELWIEPRMGDAEIAVLQLLPGAVTSTQGWTLTDTLRRDFITHAPDHFARMTLSLPERARRAGLLFELLDERGQAIRTWASDGSAQWEVNRLLPGPYRVRWIEDENANGRWDPGNYATGLQPERVVYLKENIQARSNWVLDVVWKEDSPED